MSKEKMIDPTILLHNTLIDFVKITSNRYPTPQNLAIKPAYDSAIKNLEALLGCLKAGGHSPRVSRDHETAKIGPAPFIVGG